MYKVITSALARFNIVSTRTNMEPYAQLNQQMKNKTSNNSDKALQNGHQPLNVMGVGLFTCQTSSLKLLV